MSKYVTNVNCLKIDKKSRRNKTLMFTLSVTWSDGCKDNTLQRQYVSLFDFHAKLKEKYKNDNEVHIPELPAAKKFRPSFLRGTSSEKKKSLVEDYFQKILQLPPCISRGEIVREFFEFVWSPESSEAALVEAAWTLTNDLDQYESIDNYASIDDTPASSSNMKVSNSSVTMAADNDATESIYLAVHSYAKRKSGEVDLHQGSTVNVMQRELSGWWFVHVQDTDEQGWAPASCLLPENRDQLVEVAVTGPLGEFQTRCDYQSIEPDELSFKKEQKVEVLEARLDGWWKVKCGNEVGLTPATHLEPVASDNAASNSASVYHHVGVYRKLSPPPRRNPNESAEELYAKVNKKDTPVQKSKRLTSTPVPASTACSIESECMYSEIETAEKLSPEDYKSPEEGNSAGVNSAQTTRHSYVNVPNTPNVSDSRPVDRPPKSVKPQRKIQSDDISVEQKPAKLSSAVGNKSSDEKQQSGSTSQKKQCSSTADDTRRDEVSSSTPPTSVVNRNQVPVNKAPIQQREKASNVKATGLFEPREQLYVLKLDRSQCEKLLSVNGKQRQYVIRESRKPGCPYALSVLSSDRVHHITIQLTVDNKYYIGQYSFESIAQIIAYYSHSALCYTSDGQEVLLGSQFVHSDAATSFPLAQ